MNGLIIAGAGALLALLIILLYNNLIKKRNEVQNIFGSLDAMLKKRYDLIPNLVSTVQNYMKYEQNVLNELTEMRAKAVNPDIDPDETINVENKIKSRLDGIMVAVEAYPDLKANQNFMQLQGSLNEIEEQISAARRAYNSAVTDFNNAIQTIPSNIVASIIGFKTKPVLETKENERKNVNVKQLFNS